MTTALRLLGAVVRAVRDGRIKFWRISRDGG
jgi:hypothetical protein